VDSRVSRRGHVRRGFLLLAGTVVVAACGSSSSSQTAIGDASSDNAVDVQAGHSVRGTVLDLGGAPVVDLYVTVSTSFCIPDRTSTSGTFDVKNVLPGAETKRLILYGPTAYRGPYASLAFAFDGVDAGDLDFSKPIVTPHLDNPLLYDAAVGDPQRLTTADGFAITIRAADLRIEGFGDPKLFSIRIPLDKAPPFGSVLSKLHVLYVLEPLQSTLAKPAPVEFPNPNALAVGTKVDIFQLDYLKGALVVTAGGHVRGDGKVVSEDGSGVTELTWLGFAPSGA